MKVFKFGIIGAVLGLIISLTSAQGRHIGPPDGYAGDPPDFRTCHACHSSYNPNSGGGFIRLDGLPSRYVAGRSYDLTLTLYDQNVSSRRWGFELTARHSDLSNGGTLVITDALNTQLSQEQEDAPVYIKQTDAGNFSGTRTAVAWRFGWIAPQAGAGAVVFYYAGIAANGDANNRYDYVYNRGSTSLPPLDAAPEETKVTPAAFKLHSVYPNPFNSQFQARCELLYAGRLEVNLLDPTGCRRALSFVEYRPAGMNTITIDSEELAAGIYLINIRFGGQNAAMRVVYLK
ncbi:MAG: hypothetical protein FJY65_05705 [Calditrichaeota bacterium]|nr:hypothetical protein [Calditrichota bacterium]